MQVQQSVQIRTIILSARLEEALPPLPGLRQEMAHLGALLTLQPPIHLDQQILLLQLVTQRKSQALFQ